MKTLLSKFFVVLCLLAFVPGCSVLNPKSPLTYEAARFNSFKSVWISTLAVYDFQMDKRVQGKISPADAQDIDAAWNTFRAAYRIALARAGGDENLFTPDEVRKLADDVLILIYSASK